MTESLAMRGANAATGFVLSSLLVCGVVVVSDTGTYALPTGRYAPFAEDVQPDTLTGPASEAAGPSTSQSITVPVKLRSPREAKARGGVAMTLPASAVSAAVRPEQRQVTDLRGDPRPGRGSSTARASNDRSERAGRGFRASSRHSATSARESRDTAPARSAFRSGGFRAASGRGS